MEQLLDRTDHNRFAIQLAERIAPAKALVPTAQGDVTTTHNMPSQIDQAAEAFDELAAFLKDTPVITSQAEAKIGSGYLERTRIALSSARDERDTRTRPLLDRLTAIREAYDIVREATKSNAGGKLQAAYNVLRVRLTSYANRIEAERIAEVERLRLEAEAKERAAREAERAEQDAIASADVGECTDVAAAIEQADTTFTAFKRADRQVQIAERSVPVRFGSVVGGRSISMRTTEVLLIEDAAKAIRIMGLTPKITEAILSSARDYRKAHEELPAGITATFERSL